MGVRAASLTVRSEDLEEWLPMRCPTADFEEVPLSAEGAMLVATRAVSVTLRDEEELLPVQRSTRATLQEIPSSCV